MNINSPIKTSSETARRYSNISRGHDLSKKICEPLIAKTQRISQKENLNPSLTTRPANKKQLTKSFSINNNTDKTV